MIFWSSIKAPGCCCCGKGHAVHSGETLMMMIIIRRLRRMFLCVKILTNVTLCFAVHYQRGNYDFHDDDIQIEVRNAIFVVSFLISFTEVLEFGIIGIWNSVSFFVLQTTFLKFWRQPFQFISGIESAERPGFLKAMTPNVENMKITIIMS